MKNISAKLSKILLFLHLAIWSAVLLTVYSFAYIDPSVMTFAVQAVAGVVIASSVIIIAYWRKAKKKIKNTLGIDDNSKKEKEDEIVEVPEEDIDNK